MKIDFSKYEGLGNDFVLIDNRHQLEPILTPEQAVKVCDRHFGVGADGVIFVLPGQKGHDYTMRIYNSDGSEPEMCGNGIRCMARYIVDLEGQDLSKTLTYTIDTLAGTITPEVQTDGQVRVNMGPPRLMADEIPTTLKDDQNRAVDVPLNIEGQDWQVTCVSMGNPHCINFVANVAAIPLAEIGPCVETHPAFPQKINAEFIEVVRPDYLKMRVWERGAGMTLACGTGACAALVAGVLNHKCDRSATLELPGGPLEIQWQGDDQPVYMTGPATLAFTGSLEV